MRPEMKQKAHASHLNIKTSLKGEGLDLLARYDQGNSITCRSLCHLCKSPVSGTPDSHTSARKTMSKSSGQPPIMRREELITVDIHSNFFNIDGINTSISESVNECMKAHFAHYRMPETVTFGNRPQLLSHAIKKFARKWLFKHETILPGNSQANGAMEVRVKIGKCLLWKCRASGENPFLGISIMRQLKGPTPVQHKDSLAHK